MRTINRAFVGRMPSGWLSSLGRRLRRRYSDWTEHRRAMATACALQYATDHELRDMGINRGDIPMILNGRYHRD